MENPVKGLGPLESLWKDPELHFIEIICYNSKFIILNLDKLKLIVIHIFRTKNKQENL